MLRAQDFSSGSLKKKKQQVINDEVFKRQENLKSKANLLETEFLKKEHENFFPELNPSQSQIEFKVIIFRIYGPSFFL